MRIKCHISSRGSEFSPFLSWFPRLSVLFALVFGCGSSLLRTWCHNTPAVDHLVSAKVRTATQIGSAATVLPSWCPLTDWFLLEFIPRAQSYSWFLFRVFRSTSAGQNTERGRPSPIQPASVSGYASLLWLDRTWEPSSSWRLLLIKSTKWISKQTNYLCLLFECWIYLVQNRNTKLKAKLC